MAHRIVVIEEPCGHGHLDRHRHPEPPPGGFLPGEFDLSSVCPGGSRRVLDPGAYVLVEKVGAVPHWPERVIEDLSDTVTLEGVYRLLDALAGGEG